MSKLIEMKANAHESENMSVLTQAAGAYLAGVVVGAQRDAPALACQAEALLGSGAAFTRVVVEIAGPAVKVVAVLVSVTDGRELMRLGQCEAIAQRQH